jgi:hypothetical protein
MTLPEVVVDAHEVCGAPGGLGMVCRHDRDRLALITNVAPRQHRLVGYLQPARLAPGHVLMGQRGRHPAKLERRRRLDATNAGAWVRAPDRCPP